jgi:uncharacterized lipoprotein NlpE involved in copper resistance
MRLALLAQVALMLAACQFPGGPDDREVLDRAAAGVPESHSSRSSLDWPGTYSGTLPCASCPGIDLVLILDRDGSYQLTTFYRDSGAPPEVVQGRFGWDVDGARITLDEAGGSSRFLVGEGNLLALDQEGGIVEGPLADRYTLSRSSEEHMGC